MGLRASGTLHRLVRSESALTPYNRSSASCESVFLSASIAQQNPDESPVSVVVLRSRERAAVVVSRCDTRGHSRFSRADGGTSPPRVLRVHGWRFPRLAL